MPIRDEAINVFMALPIDGPRLELTYNHGVTEYELGTGYGHIAASSPTWRPRCASSLPGTSAKPPYRVREAGSLLCFVRDPSLPVELIEKAGR